MNDKCIARVVAALDGFSIELPSWGFADTGTRFGKFFQAGAAIDIYDKIGDAGEVHRLTGCCPEMAVHVLWDFGDDFSTQEVLAVASKVGVKIGAINPNVFQDQDYKLGSVANPDPVIRQKALDHLLSSIRLGQETDSRLVSLWFADGTNYPGQDCIRDRKRHFEAALEECHQALGEEQILLVEYKPFEPAFYQTDIADWGMALLLARKAGPKAKVLVDTGHHYSAQNIEQIVAWLLDEGMLGGFHFNDRRYADDDLTLGSIDPYQVFRIFAEIHQFNSDPRQGAESIAYMVDQSHNLKPKIEAMIQTAMLAQEFYAKAALIDWSELQTAQRSGNIVDAERVYQKAFRTDVTMAVEQWRLTKGLDSDPLNAFRESGYLEKATLDRTARREQLGISQSSSYA
jgi:L-rhamnose isomerase / sugar isomerase